MSSEEDQDVFEITDFTTASEWERFIARIEEVIHEWKLPLQQPRVPAKKGEIENAEWEEKNELILFGTFRFQMTHHYMKKDSNESKKVTPQDDIEEEEPLPTALGDLMSRENDFPSKAHCLVRWYGLQDFVVIHPSKTNEAIMTEDRSMLLLSSVCIAINNTNCQVPLFVQLQQMRQKFYLGICEGGGIRTNFDMVHLHHIPSQYSHLSGLVPLFKAKVACPIVDAPIVTVAVRFTYVLQDWSLYSWPQPPPTQDFEDISLSELGRLPFGALADTILELHLSTTWPHFTADVVIDSDVHSDLDPLQAPVWTVRVRTSENVPCLMAEYLKQFYELSEQLQSTEELLGKDLDDDDKEVNQHITQALDRIAEPNPSVSMPMPKFPRIMQSRSSNQESFINEEILIKILQFIFPDSAPTPSGEEINKDQDDWKDSVTSINKENSLLSTLQEHMRTFKSAPENSLTWRLTLAMCEVSRTYGGLVAVAHLWRDFLLEMRHRWEFNYTLPCIESGPPNLTCCLLHQKLQMLNCCIERKKNRAWQQRLTAEKQNESKNLDSSTTDSDDEFFECNDSPAQKDDGTVAEKMEPEGRLGQLGNMTLLNSREPLYIPITQEPAPVTEDLLKEQTDVLVKLGTNPEGTALRAKMQSACLMSDMESFKAANPGGTLEDFVRWYSPRDWVEEEVTDEETGKKITKGHLSARMQLPGNMWLEAWEYARPIPARRQKRLFDDTKEAERVLHFLASLKPAEVVNHLMPVLIHCAILDLASHEDYPQSLAHKLEETALKAAKVMRNPDASYYDILRCLSHAELILAQVQSLQSKFGLASEERSDSVSTDKRQLRITGASEVRQFILDLLDNFEMDVPDASRGIIGKKIRHLFSEAQKASHLIIDDKPLASSVSNSDASHHHPTVFEFPSPSAKEFILRTMSPRPAPYSIPAPQRMYCVLTSEQFRLAGAFSEDTTFQ